MMTDFNNRLPRTVRSFSDNKRYVVENNIDFLRGKSLLEFGVLSGHSLSIFSHFYDQFEIEKIFFGFDSFKGLPKEEIDENNPDYWGEGAFIGSTAESVKNMLPFVNIKDGWFEDTLNQQTLEEVKKTDIGIIHIDCDIYTSTIQVLEWIVNNNLLVDGTLIVYDDWGGHYDKNVGEFECGEGKAHREICEKYNLNFDFITCDVITDKFHEVCVFRYNAN